MSIAILTLVTLLFPATPGDPLQTADIVGGDGPKGILEFRIEAPSGEATAARLSVLSSSGKPPAFANRKALVDDLALRPGFIHTLSGTGRVTLPIGEWTIWASRGLEWSVARVDVTIEEDISQLPILRDGEPVGSLREAQVIECLLRGEEGVNQPVSNIMERPFPIVDEGVTADDILERLSISSPAVLVKTNRGSLEILTNWDLIHSVRRKR